MKINPYLSFDGQCQAALRFYERCLGGKIVYMMTYSESPVAAQVPPEWAKRIYHATFSLGDQADLSCDVLLGRSNARSCRCSPRQLSKPPGPFTHPRS